MTTNRKKIGRAPVQLNGDFYFISNKFQNTEDTKRYSARVAIACEELMATPEYQSGTYNSRPKIFASELPKLAIKHRVKLKRLIKIFEAI